MFEALRPSVYATKSAKLASSISRAACLQLSFGPCTYSTDSNGARLSHLHVCCSTYANYCFFFAAVAACSIRIAICVRKPRGCFRGSVLTSLGYRLVRPTLFLTSFDGPSSIALVFVEFQRRLLYFCPFRARCSRRWLR